jgi:hypothetical protein
MYQNSAQPWLGLLHRGSFGFVLDISPWRPVVGVGRVDPQHDLDTGIGGRQLPGVQRHRHLGQLELPARPLSYGAVPYVGSPYREELRVILTIVPNGNSRGEPRKRALLIVTFSLPVPVPSG